MSKSKAGGLEVHSTGSLSVEAESSVSVAAMSVEELKKTYGLHCAGWLPPAGDGTVPQ